MKNIWKSTLAIFLPVFIYYDGTKKYKHNYFHFGLILQLKIKYAKRINILFLLISIQNNPEIEMGNIVDMSLCGLNQYYQSDEDRFKVYVTGKSIFAFFYV